MFFLRPRFGREATGDERRPLRWFSCGALVRPGWKSEERCACAQPRNQSSIRNLPDFTGTNCFATAIVFVCLAAPLSVPGFWPVASGGGPREGCWPLCGATNRSIAEPSRACQSPLGGDCKRGRPCLKQEGRDLDQVGGPASREVERPTEGGERGPLVTRLGQIRGAFEGGDLVVGKLEEEAALARGESAAVLEDEARKVLSRCRNRYNSALSCKNVYQWCLERFLVSFVLPRIARPTSRPNRQEVSFATRTTGRRADGLTRNRLS